MILYTASNLNRSSEGLVPAEYEWCELSRLIGTGGDAMEGNKLERTIGEQADQ